MDQSKLLFYKKMLLAKKEDLEKSLLLYAHRDPYDEGGFSANYEDMGYNEEDNAQEIENYSRNKAMEETIESSLAKVNRALERIENGTYGVCIKSGKPISEDRLMVMPEAETAV